MEKKHQVHNLVILDESGSMQDIKKSTISGFNELVQTMKNIEKEFTEQEHLISFVSFNSDGNKIHHFIDPVAKIEKLNAERYHPDNMTPLYDAMGFSINKLRQVLEGKTDYNVLVTIFTDGMENHSREYSHASITKLIEELKEQNWTFTYIGTDHDVEKTARDLKIDNVREFSKDEASMASYFMSETASRRTYSRKIRDKEDTKSDFYAED